jgi:HEAT repeat protein
MSLKLFPSSIIVALLCFVGYLVFPADTSQLTTPEISAEDTVKQMWSSDPVERATAKVELLKMGPKAIPPLLIQLGDIIKSPAGRYSPGREVEASALEASYEAAPKDVYSEEKFQAARQLMTLDITHRLREDTCEILGRLHAEDAVPLLIQVMEDREVDEKVENMTTEMQALVEIGAPSVPPLIEALEGAEQKAASIRFPDTSSTEESIRFYIKLEIYKLKARASMVLGEIRDIRALPVLENALSTTSDEFLKPYLEAAINKIRKKAGLN